MSPFLSWGYFHARLRSARSTTPEEKWGSTRSLVRLHLASHANYHVSLHAQDTVRAFTTGLLNILSVYIFVACNFLIP